MRHWKEVILIVLLSIPCLRSAYGVEQDFQGQFSLWMLTSYEDDTVHANFGTRYIPQWTATQGIGDDTFVDIEMSLNGFAAIDSEAEPVEDADLDLYRAKLRFATNQAETQIGLQKLNFGPAQLLRSLQWFDKVDPHDPLQLTDGVYALRCTYNFLNNANLWLWGLYGNEDQKGLELFASSEGIPEFGGRVQYPLLDGELAATVHTRKVDGSGLRIPDFRENRFALDGRWEAIVGLWFETVLQQQRSEELPYTWRKLTTLGVDYTFGLGNGLYAVGEHFMNVSSETPLGWDNDAHVSGASLNYPINFFDSVTAIGYYFWDQHEHSLYVTWQRAYDEYSLNVSLFDLPDIATNSEFRHKPFYGYGWQIMVVFYH